MDQLGNIPVLNTPETLFRNIPRNFIWNLFRIYWEYLMGMVHEYSTNFLTLRILIGKSTLNQNFNAYKKYEYGHFGSSSNQLFIRGS